MTTHWTPERGVLFVRHLLDPGRSDVSFGYADGAQTGSALSYRSIARIHNWRGEPSFGGWVDTAEGQMDHTGSGAAIVRRYAEVDDVEALTRLWSSRVPNEEWAESVASEAGLSDESKAMVARVVGRAKD